MSADVEVKKLGPDTPWAMQVVKDRKRRQEPRVEPVHKPRRAPWVEPDTSSKTEDEPVFVPFEDKDAAFTLPLPEPEQGKQSETPERIVGRQTKKVGPFQRSISAQNYAAVEPKRGEYGLIDMGPAGHDRSLIVHASSRKTPDVWRVLNAIRPGTRLLAKAVAGGPACSLRVRYTTPARYYSPGARVTSLAIAVDGADWGSLMADARHR